MTPLPLGILASSFPLAAGAYDLLETQVLTSSASSVTFTGLGSYTDYKHLQIRAVARSDRINLSDVIDLQFNADTGSNYSYHDLRGNDGSVSSSASTSNTKIRIGSITGGLAGSTQFGAAIADILDFSSSSKNTTIRSLSGGNDEIDDIRLFSGLWINTNALTSITMFCAGINFVAGCRFSLYGVR